MKTGNILVIGESGVGKSTLINAVLGENRAVTGWGSTGTTKELSIYESDEVPFRLIDSVGFEPSFFKERMAINAVKRWSKDSAKDGGEERRIHMIWFCVDGTSRKLFPTAIKNLARATSMWESIPVIVAITKSYSLPERRENIEMVYSAFAKQKRYSTNLRKVIPVVAAVYEINESTYVAPDGITELIDATNALLPEGIKAAEEDVFKFKLERKRVFAQSVVGAATAGAVAVGAVPLPWPDATVLGPLELAEINGLAAIYGINKDEESKEFIASIVEVGTVSLAAKAAVNALKAIPGIGVPATVLNSIVAGSIVAAIGEGSIYAFEQVYLGKKSTADIAWVKNLIESKLSSQFMEKIMAASKKLTSTSDEKGIVKAILEVFK